MAKKIEGYGLEEGNYWQEGKPTGSKANWQEATLIIGEKAFTESEVRAMLEDMRNDPEMNGTHTANAICARVERLCNATSNP